MEKEIKSSIINNYIINSVQSKEVKNTKKDCSIELKIESNKEIEKVEIKNTKLEKAKEMLQKLLKDTLDKRLTICEKKSKNHFFIINSTSNTTHSLTNLTIKMNKQIQEKIKKDKEKQSKLRNNKYDIRSRKGLSPNKSNIIKTHSNFYRNKTPSHINKTGKKIDNKTPIYSSRKDLFKNKSNNTLVKSSKSSVKGDRSSRRMSKRKSLGNKIISTINLNNDENNLEDLHSLSITSLKTFKININSLKTINNSKIRNNNLNRSNNKFQKTNTEVNLNKNIEKENEKKFKKIFKKKIGNNYIDIKSNKNISKNNNSNLNNLTFDDKRNKRKKTPFKKRDNSKNEKEKKNINNSNTNIKKKEKTIEDEMDAFLSIENNLQKENLLNINDPLLILPLSDLDFIPKGIVRKYSSRTDKGNNEKNFIFSFDVLQNLEKLKFKIIFKYLNLDELLSIKNISKQFHQLVITYLLEKLENEKLNILKIKEELKISTIPKREGIGNIILSKGAKKAIELLNESQLNHLFKNDDIPVDEILLIYRIYFQMINHPFAKIAKTDIEKFWEKCKIYFTKEQNGRTGDILNNMINEIQIEINGNNLYQIYNLVKGNFNKIIPNYFSNICGTTGLFCFVIKDILDFLGISPKIKNKENAYWTYTDIIDSINQKINYFKLYYN